MLVVKVCNMFSLSFEFYGSNSLNFYFQCDVEDLLVEVCLTNVCQFERQVPYRTLYMCFVFGFPLHLYQHMLTILYHTSLLDLGYIMEILGRNKFLYISFQKLGINHLSILGWSDGGTVGMLMAARCPDIVQKLVVWGAQAYITQKDIAVFESKF